MQRGDPSIEKLIAIQNSHYEKLNQLESLLMHIVKNMDNDRSKETLKNEELATVMANELTYSEH